MSTPKLRKPENLLQLEEPANPNGGPPNLKAFLEMGFRPLYLGGIAWALVAIAVWIYAPMALTGPLPVSYTHLTLPTKRIV